MFKNIYYGWWVVVSCFLISLYVGSIAFFGFTAFFEPLVKEFGWSYTQVSLGASLRGLEMGVFAFPIGFLVDRYGSRKLIFSGVIICGLGLILLSFTQSLLMFYGSILLLGLGAGGCTIVVTMSAVATWFDKNVGKAFGVMASGFGASGLLVPIIVWLIEVYQWRAALLILGLGMWVLGIPLSYVIRNKPAKYPASIAAEPADKVSPQEDLRNKKPEIPFREVIRNPSFLYLNIVEAIRMMIVSAVITHIMPYLGSIGISRTTAGLVAAAIPLASNIGRLGLGWLGDVWTKRYVMAMAFFLMGAGMITLCFLQRTWMIFPFLFFFPPSFGGTMVLRGAILREYFGKESFGKMIGMVMSSASIGGIVGPTFAGWVFDTMGTYLLAWIILSGFATLSIILVLRIKPLPTS